MILAIETSTNVCSLAFENEAGEIFEKRTEIKGSHSEKLFLFIKELMEEHGFMVDDLETVLVSEGPGSYTGLRIAASGVKGLLFGTEVEMYGVQTLASFANAALEKIPEATSIHAIIDARRKHVYHQKFSVRDDKIITSAEVKVTPIKLVEKNLNAGEIIIGTGIERLDQSLIKDLTCLGKESISAQSMITLFHSSKEGPFMHKVAPAAFDPSYYTSSQV